MSDSVQGVFGKQCLELVTLESGKQPMLGRTLSSAGSQTQGLFQHSWHVGLVGTFPFCFEAFATRKAEEDPLTDGFLAGKSMTVSLALRTNPDGSGSGTRVIAGA